MCITTMGRRQGERPKEKRGVTKGNNDMGLLLGRTERGKGGKKRKEASEWKGGDQCWSSLVEWEKGG